MLVSINKFTFERIPRFLMNELPFTVNLVSLHLPLIDYLSHWELYRAILTRELFLLIAFSHVLPVPAIVSKLNLALASLLIILKLPLINNLKCRHLYLSDLRILRLLNIS